MDLNKDRIKQRFAGAADTYDAQAVIQHKVADKLLKLLEQNTRAPFATALEIGCCTGLLTRKLAQRFPNIKKLYVNDLVPEFRQIVESRISRDIDLNFIAGDIESVPLPVNIELVISSSTFHWLNDMPMLFKKLAAHMAPGSTLAFSMYGINNLLELRDITGIGLDYLSLKELKQMVAKDFSILSMEEELITFDFKEPLEVLYHLRETGVNSLDSSGWNKSRLKNFCKKYRALFEGQENLKLTYHPMYCIAKKATF